MKEPKVILVDENDNETGTAGKLDAHRHALLHRAVSVFIVTPEGKWILQRRALDKYHSNGLWTNTCCTHPEPGESTLAAAQRRLTEEMGIKGELRFLFSFIYREKLDNNLTEHELDHVFLGITDDEPVINTDEVHEWRELEFDDLKRDVKSNPDRYTYWFREIFERVNDFVKQAELK